MKLSRRTSRTPAKFSDSVQRQLNMYALAASAAGVGALAMAPPAHAKIVYTRANQNLPINQDFFLDVDHNGVNDFRFYNWSSAFGVRLSVFPAVSGNQEVGVKGGFFSFVYASALKAGALIGQGQPFQSNAMMGFGSLTPRQGTLILGYWGNSGQPVNHRYLGLKFLISGQIHYGWARFNVWVRPTSLSATLTGYAYETIPNKPILAGNIVGLVKNGGTQAKQSDTGGGTRAEQRTPASLGVLALGSRGLRTWRKNGGSE